MTEVQWLACDDPVVMIAECEPRLSQRRRYLLAAALCRCLAPWLKDQRSWRGIEAIEDRADGRLVDLELVYRDALRARQAMHPIGEDVWAAAFAVTEVMKVDFTRFEGVLEDVRGILGDRLPALPMASAIRDIAGPVTSTCHLVPKSSTVQSVAQAAYSERLPDAMLDPVRLAILADALEEEGIPQEVQEHGPLGTKWLCTECEERCELKDTYVQGNKQLSYSCPNHGWRSDVGLKGWRWVRKQHPILAHLRAPGPHYRGCWAVDLILGKE